MAMDFKRRLPIPMEIREEMPLSAELTAKNQITILDCCKRYSFGCLLSLRLVNI